MKVAGNIKLHEKIASSFNKVLVPFQLKKYEKNLTFQKKLEKPPQLSATGILSFHV